MNGHILKGMLPVLLLAGLATEIQAAPGAGMAGGGHALSASLPGSLPIVQVQVGGGQQGGAQQGGNGDGNLPCRYRADQGACGNYNNRKTGKMPAVAPPGCHAIGAAFFCPPPRRPRLKFDDGGCCHRTVKRVTMRINGRLVRGYRYGKWHCHANKLHRHCLPRGKR